MYKKVLYPSSNFLWYIGFNKYLKVFENVKLKEITSVLGKETTI